MRRKTGNHSGKVTGAVVLSLMSLVAGLAAAPLAVAESVESDGAQSTSTGETAGEVPQSEGSTPQDASASRALLSGRSAVVKPGWVDSGGLRYYVNAQGVRHVGWLKLGTIWYYLGSDGAMATGWKNVSGPWYYLGVDGEMATGWADINSERYFLNDSGAMATGWKLLDKTWFYLNGTGAMAKGWKNLSGTWYLLGDDGTMATGWKQLGGSWYYLNASGAMATGWKNTSGPWYYLDPSGAMATGWRHVNGYWYYMNPNGDMAVGWRLLDKTWYYLNGNGAMAVGVQRVDGRVSRFDSNGAWLGYGEVGDMMAESARSQLGQYQDCTVLVERALRSVGVPAGDLGTQAYEYTSLGGKIVSDKSSLKEGDVLMWPGQHVAVYVGDGMAVHSGWNGSNTVLYTANYLGGPWTVVRFA